MPVPCGSPPWIMNFGITRWIIVPSYRRSFDFLPVDGCVHSRLPSARSIKFFTVFGASFSNNLQTIFPSVVSNTAYVPGCLAMLACPFLITPWSVWHRRPRLCGDASRFHFVILSTSLVRWITIALQTSCINHELSFRAERGTCFCSCGTAVLGCALLTFLETRNYKPETKASAA